LLQNVYHKFIYLFYAFKIKDASMPGLVRKILIFAGVDGLVLQPLGQRGQRPAKIAYTDNSIGPVLKDGDAGDAAGKSFEAFGIVGKCPSACEH
jgi:hypothetical protein